MPLGYPRDDSFQAPDFYQRLGYEVFGVIDRHPWGYQKVFLQKRLAWRDFLAVKKALAG